MTSDLAALWRAAALHPDDDTPRLVAADMLDDTDTEESRDRAALVRAECELAKWGRYVAPPEILEIANSGRLYAQSAIDLITDQSKKHNGKYDSLAARIAELKARYLGLCPDCVDSRRMRPTSTGLESSGRINEWLMKQPCPTCVLATRIRWDRAVCPECSGGYTTRSGTRYCPLCGGTDDLFRRRPTPPRLDVADRPIHTDRGVIYVGATLDEAVEEVECRCVTVWTPPSPPAARFRPMVQARRMPKADCPNCHGTGRIPRPSPWLRALLTARPDCGCWIEGVEPQHDEAYPGWTFFGSRRADYQDVQARFNLAHWIPKWLLDLLPKTKEMTANYSPVFDSPDLAKLLLNRAVSRWAVSEMLREAETQAAAVPQGEG